MIIIIKANNLTSSLGEINCRHDTVNIFLGPLLQALSIDSCSCPIQFYCYLWFIITRVVRVFLDLDTINKHFMLSLGIPICAQKSNI